MSAAVAAAAVARPVFRELHGVVVSSGLMQRTVKVRVGGQKWNNRLKKYFNDPKTFMVHDPNSSLRTGDVVAITPGWRMSKHKRHVVKHIIAPAAIPAEERPPVPTEEERWAARVAKRQAKEERRAARKEAEKGTAHKGKKSRERTEELAGAEAIPEPDRTVD